MAADLSSLQQGIRAVIEGQEAQAALSVLVTETARVLVGMDLPNADLRQLTAVLATVLQTSIAKGVALRDRQA